MSLQLFGYKSSSVNTALLATSTQATTIITNTTEPAQDATANATMADVIGNKTDAAQVTVGTTRSLMGYLKACVNALIFPAADATTNTAVSEVVGNKTDASQTTVGTTRSLMGYIKGILNSVGVNSIQTFSITMDDPATTNTATITSINTARYILIPLGWTTNNTTSGTTVMGRMILTNATTVTASRQTGTGQLIGYGMVIELKA